MKLSDYTPAERGIILALREQPGRTLDELQSELGIKTKNYFARAVRTLHLATVLTAESGADGITRYSLPTPAEKEIVQCPQI
jgi:hypothetical protein